VRCYKVPYGVSNACIIWISLKMLYLLALASFADAKLLERHSLQCSIFVREVIALVVYVYAHMHTLCMV
jgi:hypothetical protein